MNFSLHFNSCFSPLLLSYYLSNMNFVSKGSFSLYSNVKILLATFLSFHINPPSKSYIKWHDFSYLFYNRYSVKLRENKGLLSETSFRDHQKYIESICWALKPPNLNIILQLKLSLRTVTFDLGNSYGSQVRLFFLYGFKAKSSEKSIKARNKGDDIAIWGGKGERLQRVSRKCLMKTILEPCLCGTPSCLAQISQGWIAAWPE